MTDKEQPVTQLAQVIPFPARPTSPPRLGVAEFAFFARYAAGLVVTDREGGRAIPEDVTDALETILDWLVDHEQGRP
jgi:hypothetical protein